MDKGCQNGIEECVSNIAYENYEGSPINEPNYKVAKTYLLKLLNEYAMKSLKKLCHTGGN